MKTATRATRERDGETSVWEEGALFLGVEGGATHTTVLLTDHKDATVLEFSTAASNLKLLSDRELLERLREIAERLPVPPERLAAAGLGLAGTRTEADRERLRRAASVVFPLVPCAVTDDLETALAAAPEIPKAEARVLVLSGTGSCCFGYSRRGKKAKTGGRGHILGDRGSAADIGLRALRELVALADRSGRWPKLGALILHALALNAPDDLIDWTMEAQKAEIAGLAVTVFEAAAQGDLLAKRILKDAATALADDALACAGRLAAHGKTVQFVFNGSVLLKNPGFARSVSARLRAWWPGAVITPLTAPGARGAVELAKRAALAAREKGKVKAQGAKARETARGRLETKAPVDLAALRDSPTERRNPRSMNLDVMPLEEAVDLMLDEEAGVARAIAGERAEIVRVIGAVIRAFQNGGRLFYTGAGTSGRLGVLDASECPPTFRAPVDLVQGIMAGGRRALWSAVEGAEDDAAAAALAIRHRNVGPKDVVVGIAASGRTPWVWGALEEAARRGAVTALVCFNPAVKAALSTKKRAGFRPDHVIAPDLGPEVLTGSTRLKAGTGTKLILNMLTTLAMSRTGRVISNLMIDLNPSNVKLRDRARRILQELTGAPEADCRAALEATGWRVKEAYERLKPKE